MTRRLICSTAKTHSISRIRTLLELGSCLSQARLSAFRHLYLESARYGGNTPASRLEKWAAVVDVLKRLDGLQTLVVILRPKSELFDWPGEELMKPLEAVGLPVLRVVSDPVIRDGLSTPYRCKLHMSLEMEI
jgi:hypothetical protein